MGRQKEAAGSYRSRCRQEGPDRIRAAGGAEGFSQRRAWSGKEEEGKERRGKEWDSV